MMYITPIFGFSMIAAIVMIALGNLFAIWKMFQSSNATFAALFNRSLDHAEKCGCCGKQEEKPDDPSVVSQVVGVAKSAATLLKG